MEPVDLNEAPRPRVLVIASPSVRSAIVSALEGLAPTVHVTTGLSTVHPSEWDALVTTMRLAESGSPRRSVPRHLQVFLVLTRQLRAYDFLENANRKRLMEIVRRDSQGKRATPTPGLDDDLAALVRRDLVPVVAARETQFGVRAEGFDSLDPPDSLDGFTPFLTGPDRLAYAARYSPHPGGSVWVVPDDVPSLRPWLEAAFAEWHQLNPQTFPGAPDWIDDPAWYSQEETNHAGLVATEVADFEAARREHEVKLKAREKQFGELRQQSAATDRQLLSGQGEPLQAAVAAALLTLGFEVEDMDLIWDERERREDYRITDPDEPGWMVIADATGTTKGVKGAKLLLVSRFVTKYMGENPGAAEPGYWVIANHFADRNPAQRPNDLTRGDELAALVETNGLVLDTVALFHLLREVQRNPGTQPRIRAALRAATGQFTTSDATALIGAAATAEEGDTKALPPKTGGDTKTA